MMPFSKMLKLIVSISVLLLCEAIKKESFIGVKGYNKKKLNYFSQVMYNSACYPLINLVFGDTWQIIDTRSPRRIKQNTSRIGITAVRVTDLESLDD